MALGKRTILLSVSLLLQIYKLIELRRNIASQIKLIDILKGLELLSIQALKEKLGKGIYKFGDYVLCHGGLKSSENMESMLYPKIPVAFS